MLMRRTTPGRSTWPLGSGMRVVVCWVGLVLGLTLPIVTVSKLELESWVCLDSFVEGEGRGMGKSGDKLSFLRGREVMVRLGGDGRVWLSRKLSSCGGGGVRAGRIPHTEV